MLLEGVWKQTKRRFLHRAFTRVRIGWLEVIGLLTLLRVSSGAQKE
jgi:hypothetical protein